MSTQPKLVFVADGEGDVPLALVVNFGVYSGREATPAEVLRLAHELLDDLPALEVVAEQRYEFTRDAEASVYRLRVQVPADTAGKLEALRGTVEAWAEDCIRERHVGP